MTALLRLSLCVVLLLWGAPLVVSQDLVPQAPSAVLLDQLTGRILFQKQPDRAIPPASLTKLMTLHLAWKALAEGTVHASDLVPITAATTGSAVPPGSSLMFLEAGQKVSLRELMLGLAVDSGNDAGLTLAQYLAGSQQAFVGAMNQESQRLGLTGTVFFDSYGFDARNRTTAGDFAKFCRFYLSSHPQSVSVLHNVRELAFPLEQNRADGDPRPVRTIVQANRNTLLGQYPGADGLKTGYIEESGYNLAATALRGNQRLVAVVLGVQGRTTDEGSRVRTNAAIRLFDFGFSQYPLRPLPVAEIKPVRVWFSSPGQVVPVPASPLLYPLSEAEWASVTVRVEARSEVEGPLGAGAVLGRMVWSTGGREFYSVPLTSEQGTASAPWWEGLWDRVVLFFRGFTGQPAPPTLSAAVPRT